MSLTPSFPWILFQELKGLIGHCFWVLFCWSEAPVAPSTQPSCGPTWTCLQFIFPSACLEGSTTRQSLPDVVTHQEVKPLPLSWWWPCPIAPSPAGTHRGAVSYLLPSRPSQPVPVQELLCPTGRSLQGTGAASDPARLSAPQGGRG